MMILKQTKQGKLPQTDSSGTVISFFAPSEGERLILKGLSTHEVDLGVTVRLPEDHALIIKVPRALSRAGVSCTDSFISSRGLYKMRVMMRNDSGFDLHVDPSEPLVQMVLIPRVNLIPAHLKIDAL